MGCLFITSGSDSSLDSAIAGSPSVIRLIHNICKAVMGKGEKNIDAKKTTDNSPRLHPSRKVINFFILSKIVRPSLIACTMVA